MTSQGNISIHALTFEDLQIFKEMRLRALKSDPDVYFGDFETSSKFSNARWEATLDGQGKQVFGLFDVDRLIGITAVFTYKDDKSGESGMMGMSFILPEYRGKGLSDLLYQARIEWALAYSPFKKLIAGHREGNEPSRKAMLKHGFQFTGKEMVNWPGDMQNYEYKYELDLEALRG